MIEILDTGPRSSLGQAFTRRYDNVVERPVTRMNGPCHSGCLLVWFALVFFAVQSL